jgi:type II secretory pathway component GspD/PulD (secretin)
VKKIIVIILCGIFCFWGVSFSQDNIYGDYFLNAFNKKVSIDLEAAQLVDVLKMLSQQTNLNFVSTEAIKDRKLTLYMEEVPLKEAMDIVFKANNLAYDYYPESKIFVVKEMGKPDIELKTKVYRLKYARVSSSRMQKEITDLIVDENSDSDNEESDTKSTQGIRKAVEAVLSPVGKVNEDALTNSLIVVDVPSQFPTIDEVIDKLDIAIPRVMIEVEMMDVSKTHLDQIGFNFANGLYARAAGPARSSYFPFGKSLMKGTVTNQTTSGGLTPPVLSILDLTDFTLVMQFLTQDTSTKFIARPKILTLSNETAEVNLTVNEAIGVTTIRGSEGGGSITQNVEREQTGTKLRVTPQVNPYTQEITLMLEIFNRESSDSGLAITGLEAGSTLKNVEERGTKNVLRLKDGETLYIGGLIRREESTTITKIPFLGDIPILGKLFSYTERPGADNQDREMLVFLTPRIVEDEPLLAKRPQIINREQNNASKRETIKVALDNFGR